MQQDAIEFYNLGYAYYTGTEGYPLNEAKAFDFFQKAAALGSSDAMNYLGIMYERGEGVSSDDAKAAEYFCKALEANPKNPYAAYHLGRFFYSGKIGTTDMDQAFQLFKLSIDANQETPHSLYGYSCYMAGCILNEHYKNLAQAFPYFAEAANANNMPEAWYNLGWLSEKGYGENSGDSTALSYYMNAARQGLPEAMDSVGRLYCSHQMFDEARPWLQQAASMGFEPSKKRLRQLTAAQSGSIWNLFR